MAKMPQQKPGKSKQDYGTPPDLLTAIKNRLYIADFAIDLAANKDNAVTSNYYSLEEGNDSLNPDLTWYSNGGWAWLNPPFGNIKPWVMKAKREATNGAQIVMLVPASVGSSWWLNYVDPCAYVSYLTPRLTFVGETTPYPKDCALLFYTPWGFTGYEIWNWRQRDLS